MSLISRVVELDLGVSLPTRSRGVWAYEFTAVTSAPDCSIEQWRHRIPSTTLLNISVGNQWLKWSDQDHKQNRHYPDNRRVLQQNLYSVILLSILFDSVQLAAFSDRTNRQTQLQMLVLLYGKADIIYHCYLLTTAVELYPVDQTWPPRVSWIHATSADLYPSQLAAATFTHYY